MEADSKCPSHGIAEKNSGVICLVIVTAGMSSNKSENSVHLLKTAYEKLPYEKRSSEKTWIPSSFQ